jgi:hypothetical protein
MLDLLTFKCLRRSLKLVIGVEVYYTANKLIPVDPQKASLRRAAAKIHYDVVKPMVANLTHRLPNAEEGEAFAEKVLEECRTSNYHLTGTMSGTTL